MSDLSDDFTPPRVPAEPRYSDTGSFSSTSSTYSTESASTGSASTGSTTDTATDQAKQVKDQAVDTTKQVAGVAVDQAQNVASEAKSQARNVMGEARQQLTDQASTQQNNLASWLSTIVEELEQMVDSSSKGSAPSGAATSLVRQASQRTRGVASWLQDHEPQDLLAETGRFARRRPAAFLGLALAGGIIAGRLTRGLTSDAHDSESPSGGGYGSAYAGGYEPVTTYGTGQSVAGSGMELPAASGYSSSVDTMNPVETYPADTYAADPYAVGEPVEDIDPLKSGRSRYLGDDAGQR